MNNHTHVKRIFSVLLLAAVLGFAAQRLLRPETYGEIGHYRAESLREIINLELIHQGQESCRGDECHEDIYLVHEKDIHFQVQCEDCHGPGDLHNKYQQGEIELINVENAMMPKEYTLEGCLFCHRKLNARPRNFAQIDPDEHYEFLHVTHAETDCIACHNPHEPLFLLNEVAAARIHPIIYECRDCHDTPPEQEHTEIDTHPVIFVCRDCHSRIVDDFSQHAHAFMNCTSCHLFYQENDNSGRIFINTHQRFCLLCHEKKNFKDDEQVPQIVLTEHIQEKAEVMLMQPEDLQNKTTVCLDCHIDFVHNSELIEFFKGIIR